jgi:hypothetical protein
VNIDPVDDCTFFYVNQYYKTTSDADWLTRFGSFRIDGCVDDAVASSDEPLEPSSDPRRRKWWWWEWITGDQE